MDDLLLNHSYSGTEVDDAPEIANRLKSD